MEPVANKFYPKKSYQIYCKPTFTNFYWQRLAGVITMQIQEQHKWATETEHKKMSPSKLIFPAACSAYSQGIWFGDGSTSVKSAIRLYSVCATGACRRLCRSSCSPSVFTAMAALSFIKF
jgi:hypothetical protein